MLVYCRLRIEQQESSSRIEGTACAVREGEPAPGKRDCDTLKSSGEKCRGHLERDAGEGTAADVARTATKGGCFDGGACSGVFRGLYATWQAATVAVIPAGENQMEAARRRGGSTMRTVAATRAAAGAGTGPGTDTKSLLGQADGPQMGRDGPGDGKGPLDKTNEAGTRADADGVCSGFSKSFVASLLALLCAPGLGHRARTSVRGGHET